MGIDRLKRLELWARLGYAARGFVYLFLGWVALTTGRALSTDDVVAEVERLPLAPVLLAVLAAGLFGYALFKLYSAAIDLDHKGNGTKGRLARLGGAIGGLAYVALGWLAFKVLLGGDGDGDSVAGRAAGSGGAGQEAATDVAQAPGGNLLLIVGAAIVVGIAIGQFVVAWKASFMAEMPRCPGLVRPIGRLGYAARAWIIGMVGWFLLRAGLDGERVRNFGDALALLRNNHEWLFMVIAAGMVAFGITSLMMARYRRIEDRDVVDDIEHGVEKGVEKAQASVKS
ncbi:MAG: DUF1206 domain-containing protein [Sphingomonas bacterium]|nr:DUF1206 domain-containing protein [Sphingomonas bacterium]